ncbi:MAG: hypothetical protein RL375_961 [Pseudomonadota bacterium]
MKTFSKPLSLVVACAFAALSAGCLTLGAKQDDAAAPATAATPAPTTTPAKPATGSAARPAKPAAASTAPTPAPAPTPSAKVPAGMNDKGEVIDSAKVEAGSGQKVKGRGNWEGEITGKPTAGSKFTKLEIGMGMKEVTDIAGQPTDQGAYVTGKAWIPFYFGADRHRFEMVFKGQGRLIFAGGSLGDMSGGNLIWIIHNARESGYRN